MGFVRTDLAMENLDKENICPGTDVHQWENGGIRITEVIIRTKEAARQLGKSTGNYLTLECPSLAQHDPDAAIAMANLLGEELGRLIAPSPEKPVLVIGLGNRNVTPDALGPSVIDKTLVTRHMLGSGFAQPGMNSVCAVAPGVLGVTGVETAEMAECLVRKIEPCAVLCIDSLAARDSARIGCTVQISNAGIQPGSGVGNHRKALTKESLGAEVIAVGVPTVVYAATLAKDAFTLLAGHAGAGGDGLESMERELLGTELGNMIVTPRDIDMIIANCATMLAGGINRALHPGLSPQEISQMMN